MSNNIGYDFGTTYSVISKMSNDGKKVEVVQPCEGETQMPSIAVLDCFGDMQYGMEAKNKIFMGYADKVFKGFKMMLAEETSITHNPNAEQKLDFEDYDLGEYAPSKIAKAFLKNNLGSYVQQYGTIDNLVIGIPAVWSNIRNTNVDRAHAVATIDNKVVLDEIFNSLTDDDGNRLLKKVIMLPEPQLAGAYVVQRFNEKNNTKFEGEILVVDFGGGTLDATLCEVENTESKCIINPIATDGLGINRDASIGSAGLSYIQDVVNLACDREGIDDRKDINKWIYATELALKQIKSENIKQLEEFYSLRTDDAENFYEMMEASLADDNNKEKYSLCKLLANSNGQQKKVYITIDILIKAFEKVEKNLNDVIGNGSFIRNQMKNNGMTKNDEFPLIALVGGFSNYCLVQKYIKSAFNSDIVNNVNDIRFFDELFEDNSNRENAISFGATLIANEKITFKHRAPFALGVAPKDIGIAPIIKCGQTIKSGEVYWGGLCAAGRIPYITFNYIDNDIDKLEKRQLPAHLIDNFDFKNPNGTVCQIGFSLDDSDIIYFHKRVRLDKDSWEEYPGVKFGYLSDIYGGFTMLKEAEND